VGADAYPGDDALPGEVWYGADLSAAKIKIPNVLRVNVCSLLVHIRFKLIPLLFATVSAGLCYQI